MSSVSAGPYVSGQTRAPQRRSGGPQSREKGVRHAETLVARSCGAAAQVQRFVLEGLVQTDLAHDLI